MGKVLSYRIEGVSKVRSGLRAYAKRVESTTLKTIAEGGDMMASTARANCKAQSIGSTIKSQRTETGTQVTTIGVISAYLEFGTGNYAAALLSGYPADWAVMAKTFYVNGLGRIPAQPYLYPAYKQTAAKVQNDIKAKVESI